MIQRKSAALGGVLLLVAAMAAAVEPSGVRSVRDDVRAYRTAHEREILGELTGLLALPNVATRVADIERNADHLTAMLARRGFKVRRLSAGEGTPPSLFGELVVPGAKRTLMFYAHYDGQPVDQKGWLSDPFKPVLRTGPLGTPGKGNDPKDVDLSKVAGPLDPEWRIYARSASDDKSPIVAILTALDALSAGGRQPSRQRQALPRRRGGAGLGAPAGRSCAATRRCSPPTSGSSATGRCSRARRQQVFFGARGVAGLELTVYGPSARCTAATTATGRPTRRCRWRISSRACATRRGAS